MCRGLSGRLSAVVFAIAIGGSASAGVLMLGVAPAAAAVASTSHKLPDSATAGVTRTCGPTTGYACTRDAYASYAPGPGSTPNWPNKYYGVGQASHNSAGYHNCTLYAAYRLMTSNGLTTDPTVSWGDASQWGVNAAAHYLVDQTPAVGAIAQWNAGHVAYVESIDATTGAITITDDNYDDKSGSPLYGGYTDQWTVQKNSDAWPDNFIHFKDIPKVSAASISVTPEPDLNLGDANTTVTYSGIHVNAAYTQVVGILQCTSAYITTSSWLNDCSVVSIGNAPSGSVGVGVAQQLHGRDCRNRDTCWLIAASNYGGDELVPEEQAAHMLSPSGPASTYPTANAGSDQIVGSGATFSLDGSGSLDPNGRPLTYSWVQVEGTSAILDDPTKVRPTVKAPTGPTTLIFKLTVTNSLGQSRDDYMFVTVKSPK